MIVSANNNNCFVSQIEAIAGIDPFACRIISLYNSYQPELVFVDYWTLINDETKECGGAIARNGSAFIIFLADENCIDEVSSFMRVAGATEIIYDYKYELDLSFGKLSSGVILKKNDCYNDIDKELEYYEPHIKELYSLIEKSTDENFVPPLFEDFYVDVNHKLRHRTMRVCGVKKDGVLVSAAMTVAESSHCAVIGAVACDPNYRNQGYGTAAVKYIVNLLASENKEVFLHRAENANYAFYEKLGFVQSGRWREFHFGG